MKCKYCGAEIKKGCTVCAYCDSAVEDSAPEVHITIKASRKPPKDIARVIGKTVIALACISAVMIIATTFITLNSDAFKMINDLPYSSSSPAQEIPKNRSGLTALVVSCDKRGIAQIEYKGDIYEEIRILDEDLIEWLNETDRKLDSVEIRFATDERGNISALGLLSADFFVIAAEGNRYTAIREGQGITFTSETSLEIDHCYGGYFSYPDMRLYWSEKQGPIAISYMDPKCEDKKTETQSEFYTGEDLTVYQISVFGRWYYCSRDTYDAIQIGDLLNEYEIHESQELAYIIKNPSIDPSLQ